MAATSVAIGLAAVLAIVAAQGAADYLATLALALAVIAFIVQIIVFIAQTGFSNQQLVRAEEINGATQRLLAIIEEKAEGTRQTVQLMNDRMLDAVVQRALPEAAAKGVAPGSPAGDVQFHTILQNVISEETNPAPRAVSRTGVRGLARLTVPEADDRSRAVAVLAELGEDSLDEIQRLGRDFERYGRFDPNEVSHGYQFLMTDQDLVAMGVTKMAKARWGGGKVYILTRLGRDVAALLLEGTVTGAEDELLEARRRLRAYQDRVDEMLSRTHERQAADES